jgi:RNA polymerase sigma-70 factor, ECF subfamily
LWKTDPVRALAFMLAVDRAEAGEQSGEADLGVLLRLAKAGDAAAFEQVLIRHERRVFLTALRLLGSVEDAEDAAQEVFLRLHKHLRRFDEAREFAPWMYRVTVNVCRDMARKRARESAVEFVDAEYSAAPAMEIGREEQRRIVREGLKVLPVKERAALVLRDIEGLPTKEVARILGSSEGTVRSQVSTGRLKIKKFADRFRRRKL